MPRKTGRRHSNNALKLYKSRIYNKKDTNVYKREYPLRNNNAEKGGTQKKRSASLCSSMKSSQPTGCCGFIFVASLASHLLLRPAFLLLTPPVPSKGKWCSTEHYPTRPSLRCAPHGACAPISSKKPPQNAEAKLFNISYYARPRQESSSLLHRPESRCRAG